MAIITGEQTFPNESEDERVPSNRIGTISSVEGRMSQEKIEELIEEAKKRENWRMRLGKNAERSKIEKYFPRNWPIELKNQITIFLNEVGVLEARVQELIENGVIPDPIINDDKLSGVNVPFWTGLQVGQARRYRIEGLDFLNSTESVREPDIASPHNISDIIKTENTYREFFEYLLSKYDH